MQQKAAKQSSKVLRLLLFLTRRYFAVILIRFALALFAEQTKQASGKQIAAKSAPKRNKAANNNNKATQSDGE